MAEKHLIIVAYAVAPGPGGPEGHVNARFLQALANYWPLGVSVITAGGSPMNDEGVPLADMTGWQYYSIGVTGADGNHNTRLSKFSAWCLTQIRDRKPGILFAKSINRIVYWLTGTGIKMFAWRYTASRILRKELKVHPGAIVYSRALPFESILAAGVVRKAQPFPWLVNINDPLPPDVWSGLYQTDHWTNLRMRTTFKKILPMIDAFTFPCRRLRDLEVAAFPEMNNMPSVILPHLTKIVPSSHKSNDLSQKKGNHLQIAFAGTLRKKRIQQELAVVLKDFIRQAPRIANDLKFVFHLARPNPYAEAFIQSLPVRTQITLRYFDDRLDRELMKADILLDIEAEEDEPLSLTKVVNYLGYQKPIWAICMPNGTTWELMTQHNCGYFSPLGDREAMLSTLHTICKDWREDKIKQSIPGPEVLERFGSPSQVEDLLTLSAYVENKNVASEPERVFSIEDWP
jgi:hypothetical protein